MKTEGSIEVRVSRRMSAAPERVFDAWLDPERVRIWMASALAGHGLSGDVRRVEIDPRVGGRFTFSDLRPDGEAVHWGRYLEIERPRRLVFTWYTSEEEERENNSAVTLTLEPDGEGCIAMIVHAMDAKWADYREGTEAGWARMLEAIERVAGEADASPRPAPARGGYGRMLAPDTVRFERWLPGPIERVWRYLTDSEKRGRWLASGEMELRVGGRVEHVFRNSELGEDDDPPPAKYAHLEPEVTIEGRITVLEPPRLLGYTWPEGGGRESEVRFELAEEAGKVLLVLTHRRLVTREMVLSVAGGWHTHLDILVDVLSGRSPEGFWRRHTQLEDEYEERIRKSEYESGA